MRLVCRLLLVSALAPVVALATATTEPSGPDTPPRAPKAPFYLITDYLPLGLYEGEPLTACFRIENTTGREEAVEVKGEVLAADGQVLTTATKELAAGTASFAAGQLDLDLAGGQRVRFKLKTSRGEVAGPVLRLLRDDEAWPKTVAAGRRLFLADRDEALLPVASRRLKADERRWAPLAWVFGTGKEQPAAGQPSWLFVPAAWGKVRAGQPADVAAVVPEAMQAAKTWTALGPYPAGGAPPVLRMMAETLEGLPVPAPKRLVVCLPPEDLEVATDPRVYRLLLDSLVARLKAAGTQEIVLLAPFHYGVPQPAQRLLWTQVQESSAAQRVRWVEPGEFLDEQFWRVDPKVRGVYGPHPNAEGLKKIEQKLAGLLR